MDPQLRELLLNDPRMVVALDEVGEMHSFSPRLAAALVERGVLWRDSTGHWRVREKDSNSLLDNDVDIAVCDFCTERPVVYECECDDFHDSLMGHSVGACAACRTCGELVAADNVEDLFLRSAQAQAHRFGHHLPDVALDMMVEFHGLFWTHYKGIRTLPTE